MSKPNDELDDALISFMKEFKELPLVRSSDLAELIIRGDEGPRRFTDHKILKDVSKAISTQASKALYKRVMTQYSSLIEKAEISMKNPNKSQEALHKNASNYEKSVQNIVQLIDILQREIPGVEPPAKALHHLRPISQRVLDAQDVYRDPNEVVRLSILTSQDETDQNTPNVEDEETLIARTADCTEMCTFFNCESSQVLQSCQHCNNGKFHHDCLDKVKTSDWPIISFALKNNSCSKCLDIQLKGYCCNKRRRPNILNSHESYYQECDELINPDGDNGLNHTCFVCGGTMHSKCRTISLAVEIHDERFTKYPNVCNYCCFVLGESESTRQHYYQVNQNAMAAEHHETDEDDAQLSSNIAQDLDDCKDQAHDSGFQKKV